MSTTKVIPARDCDSIRRIESVSSRFIKEVVCTDTIKPYPELQTGELFNKLASMMSSVTDLVIEPMTTCSFKMSQSAASNHPLLAYYIVCDDTKGALEHYVLQSEQTWFKLLIKNTSMSERKFSIYWI